jgi:glycosyltransferase involved in cell wall biosynthesis
MKASAGKRILMLLENSTYQRDNRVRREAHSLIAAGYQVSLICPIDQGQPWHQITPAGVHLYCFTPPTVGSGVRGYLWEYAYSMAAAFLISLFICFYRGFDVVHAHNPPDTFVLLGVFYKLLGKKFVYDHHDLSPEMFDARFRGKGSSAMRSILTMFEWLSCRMADHVIATNHSYKQVEMERDGVPEHRITVVRNGPDLRRVQLVDPDPELRKKASLIIGYVGVLGIQDGVDYLIRALKHLRDDLGRTDFYCVIVGRGDALNELKELSTNFGLNDHILFTGPARIPDADLMRYLSTTDVCVAPDPKNDFTNRSTMIKIMEYMALSKPVVAFDLTEHRFSAGDAALYAQSNDELDFARQIAVLMDDPDLRQRMGQHGRERIDTMLAWPHQEQQLLDAYTKLL